MCVEGYPSCPALATWDTPRVTDPEPNLTPSALRAALSLANFDGHAAQRLMEPAQRGVPSDRTGDEPPRDAAALAYVFERGGILQMPLTLRHADLREHRGQVSLPGGRPDAGESLWQTALREANEEVGLDVSEVERLGQLSPVYIPITHTTLHVHVCWGVAPEDLRANPGEVERVEVVRLAALLDPTRRGRRVLRIRDRDVDVPYFDLAGLFVWGATAMALSDLAERLRAALP